MAKVNLRSMSVEALLQLRDEVGHALTGRAGDLQRQLAALGKDVGGRRGRQGNIPPNSPVQELEREIDLRPPIPTSSRKEPDEFTWRLPLTVATPRQDGRLGGPAGHASARQSAAPTAHR
jgi:hypothetical protein